MAVPESGSGPVRRPVRPAAHRDRAGAGTVLGLSRRARRAIEDGLACDAVLFEGGAFADFLAVRGSLLPEDERLLAEQWLLVERSVHEVVAVRRGEGMTLRDVRTGDVHEVRERAGSRQVKAGELYCARVVPAGDTMQIFGGIEPVSVGERDELIALLDDDPDPVELVAFLSRRFAPPVLQNTEGESLVMCDATLRVHDPAGLAEALDDEYDRDDDEPDGTLVWFEHVITHGMQRIRAHIELSGDELHVHANSEARFERVLATIGTLDPSVTVLRETREPAGDLRAVQRLAARSPATPAHVPRPGRRSGDRCGARRDGPQVRGGLARRADSRAGRSHTPRMRQRPDPPPRPDPAARLVPAGHRPTRHDEPGTPTGRPGPELTLRRRSPHPGRTQSVFGPQADPQAGRPFAAPLKGSARDPLDQRRL